MNWLYVDVDRITVHNLGNHVINFNTFYAHWTEVKNTLSIGKSANIIISDSMSF